MASSVFLGNKNTNLPSSSVFQKKWPEKHLFLFLAFNLCFMFWMRNKKIIFSYALLSGGLDPDLVPNFLTHIFWEKGNLKTISKHKKLKKLAILNLCFFLWFHFKEKCISHKVFQNVFILSLVWLNETVLFCGFVIFSQQYLYLLHEKFLYFS